VLDYLVDNDFVALSQLDKAFEVAKAKRKPAIELPKLENRVQSLAESKER